MAKVIASSVVLTKDAAARALGLRVYDLALPQTWLDDAVLNLKTAMPSGDLYMTLLSGTVWCYDKGVYGRPVALDEKTLELLVKLTELKDWEPHTQDTVLRFIR